MKLSVIIPTYNTPGKRLRRCMESIYSQDFNALEVIVIDDGSGDQYKKDLINMKLEYPFILFQQNRRGVSAARNLGIEKSCGEYLMFVDADDTLEPDSLKRAIKLIHQYHADIVLGGINIIKGSEVKSCCIHQKAELICKKSDINSLQRYMLAIRCEKNNDLWEDFRCTGPWAKIIKRDLIKDIRFDENLQIYEDLMFNLQMLDRTDCAIIDPAVWYDYYIYSESSLHQYRANGMEQMEYVAEKLEKFVTEHDEFKSASAVKIMECLKRLFTTTVFHDENASRRKLSLVKNILDNPYVDYLLNQFDEEKYSFTDKKERMLWIMFKKKYYILVSVYYIIRSICSE